jgi:hypothetical protein
MTRHVVSAHMRSGAKRVIGNRAIRSRRAFQAPYEVLRGAVSTAHMISARFIRFPRVVARVSEALHSRVTERRLAALRSQ